MPYSSWSLEKLKNIDMDAFALYWWASWHIKVRVQLEIVGYYFSLSLKKYWIR